MVKVTDTASLGYYCFSSSLLKAKGWKRYSLPFDWVFSSEAVVLSCLLDDFRTFLDRSLYTPHNSGGRPTCGHRTYCSKMFNHHDPLSGPQDYDYFVRCVARFRALRDLPEGRHILFLLTPWSPTGPPRTLVKALNQYLGHPRFTVLVVNYHHDTARARSTAFFDVYEESQVVVCTLYTESARQQNPFFPLESDNERLMKMIEALVQFEPPVEN